MVGHRQAHPVGGRGAESTRGPGWRGGRGVDDQVGVLLEKDPQCRSVLGATAPGGRPLLHHKVAVVLRLIQTNVVNGVNKTKAELL